MTRIGAQRDLGRILHANPNRLNQYMRHPGRSAAFKTKPYGSQRSSKKTMAGERPAISPLLEEIRRLSRHTVPTLRRS
jgi:hypothetical protein